MTARPTESSNATSDATAGALALAVLAGAFAGVAEASGFAFAQSQYLRSGAESLAVLGAPVVLGAAGGLFGGAVLIRLLRPAPLRVLVPLVLAVAAVLRWRRIDFANSGAWIVAAAVAFVGASVLVACRRMTRRPARRILLTMAIVLAVWPIVTFAALVSDGAGAGDGPATNGAAVRPPIPYDSFPTRPDEFIRHIVLVTWDTVRADVLPLWGGGGLDTPVLDQIAREGIVYERAFAVAPITGPAHLSLLTGLYPPQHGLRSNGDPAPPPTGPHLAEELRWRGYSTAGFVSNLALMRRSGFDRGFDRFDDRPSAPPSARFIALARLGSIFLQRLLAAELGALAHQTPGEVTLKRACEWIARTPDRSFLWTHFYDAHAPYSPHEPYASRTRARGGEGLQALDPKAQADVIAQRGEIEHLDHLLGELRAALEARDPGLDSTLLIVVGDHGECFGEGGQRGHHQSLFHATQHIPLVVRPPSLPSMNYPRGGTRVDEPVVQVDVLPTVLGALTDQTPNVSYGTSLFALANWGEPAARGFYFEAFQRALGSRRLQGWQEGAFKYVRDLAGYEWLYRLDGEAGEREVDDGARSSAMRERLDDWLAAHAAGTAASTSAPLSESDAEALRALGYGER